MALNDLNFDAISESDLRHLIANGTQEGVRIEYKRETYGATDAEKKEYLKDASSFANAMGGHLLIGMEEAGGLPTVLVPFIGDADAELQRLENLLRDAVEPRIHGVRMRAIPVPGGNIILIRMPRSLNAPHRINFKGSRHFYGRTSAGAYELGVDELRTKFNGAATAFERAQSFRERRLALISAGEGIVPLAQTDGRLVVHVVPFGSVGGAIVDLERAKTQASGQLSPIGAAGWSAEFNFDGFANIRSGEEIFGYTQLFRDGCIEATKVRVTATHEGVTRIPAKSLGDPLIRSVENYIDALQQLDVQAPLCVMITLEGVRGAHLAYSQSQWLSDPAIIRQDRLELPPVVIGEYGSHLSYQSALRPAFDALWNAGGLAKCTYFANDGSWRPHD